MLLDPLRQPLGKEIYHAHLLWLRTVAIGASTEVGVMKALMDIDLHFWKRLRWFLPQDEAETVLVVFYDLILLLFSAGEIENGTKLYRAVLWEGMVMHLNKSQCRTYLELFISASILFSQPTSKIKAECFFEKNCSDWSHWDHLQKMLEGVSWQSQ